MECRSDMDTRKVEELLRKLIDASTFNSSVLVLLCRKVLEESPYTPEMLNEQTTAMARLLEEAIADELVDEVEGGTDIERVALSVLEEGGYWVDLPAKTLEEAAREYARIQGGDWRATVDQPLTSVANHPVARRRFREWRANERLPRRMELAASPVGWLVAARRDGP